MAEVLKTSSFNYKSTDISGEKRNSGNVYEVKNKVNTQKGKS